MPHNALMLTAPAVTRHVMHTFLPFLCHLTLRVLLAGIEHGKRLHFAFENYHHSLALNNSGCKAAAKERILARHQQPDG
jgi:hypothetical protein